MPNASVARTARRALDFAGQTVDLTNYESDTTTERVETWDETSASPHAVTARVVPRNTPQTSRDVREEGDAELDVRVYIADDASGVGAIRDGGGQGASVIDVGQTGTDDYRVIVKTDEDNGIIRLDCELID